jgi:hypothetical protein
MQSLVPILFSNFPHGCRDSVSDFLRWSWTSTALTSVGIHSHGSAKEAPFRDAMNVGFEDVLRKLADKELQGLLIPSVQITAFSSAVARTCVPVVYSLPSVVTIHSL